MTARAPLSRPMVLRRSGAIGFFFGLGLLLSPVYLGESGGVQIAHIFFLAALLFGVSRIKPSAGIDFLVATYVLYAFVREALAVLEGAEISTLLPVAQLTFGLLIYLLTKRSFVDYEAFARLPKWCFGAAAIATAGVLVLGSGGLEAQNAERAIGTFNNPNQLGYFGVLLASISILMAQRGALANGYAFVLIAVCIYLCVVSLSKSAMGSAVLVFAAYVAQSFSRKTAQFLLSAVVVALGLYIALESGALRVPALDDFAAYQRIIGAARENDTSFAVRGYSILNDAPWFDVVFGLSSAGVAELRGGYEVHSTYMAPIAAYGLLGGGMFILFLVKLSSLTIRRMGLLGFFAVLLPTLLYGVAHNGGRTALFWCLVGLISAQLSRRIGSDAGIEKGHPQ